MKHLNYQGLLVFVVSILIAGCKKDDPEPVANFSFNPNTAEIGDTITFTNLSKNATVYMWDFGDESISNDKNPTHAYIEAGTYDVELTASGDGGVNKITKPIEITVPPYNIVPGEKIGDFFLGDNMGTNFQKIEETTYFFMTFEYYGSYMHFIEFRNTGIGFFIESNYSTIRNSDVPTGILAFEPFEGNTEKGITFGSLLTQVEAVYGTPDDISSSGSYYYDETLGIEFWADDSETYVETIYICEPSSFKNAYSVTSRLIDAEQLFKNR